MHGLAEFTASGPAVLVYARGAYCPFCLRQLADYRDRYRDFKQAGVEVFAISPESPRRSRRLRKQLRLPFKILSDSKLELARDFGLMGHEKAGAPTPATLILDGRGGVIMSTLNDWTKCVVARDALAFVRALKQERFNLDIGASSRQAKTRWLFLRKRTVEYGSRPRHTLSAVY